MSASIQTVQPISAEGFLDTLGTDTHMAYTDGGYADVAQVIADLKYLGIDQVRDGITNGLDGNGNPNGSAPISTYIAMAQAGIKFTFVVEATSTAAIQTVLALINQVETAVPGSVLAIEGPNEVNNQPITFNGLTGQAGAVAAQQALYQAVQADTTLAGVPVDYFTGYTAGSTDPNTTPGLSNFDNQHPYPVDDEAPAFWVSRAQALTNLSSTDVATAPAVYTETGYSTDNVPADVQENYTLDLLMDTAKDGISQTYLYDLLDAYAPGSTQGDDGFGLFDDTGAPKPVATAIHNLTSLLQDTGATAATFKPASLTYTLSGLPSTGNSMVLEKSNGNYFLVVWAEPQIFNATTDEEIVASTENVTVTLPNSFASIQVFDPTLGTAAISSTTNASSVTVAVTDHPIIIELAATTPVTAAAPVLTIATPVQLANTTEVSLSGTVTDATATTVLVEDGNKVLGNATVSNGAWTYTTGSLAAGSDIFSAVATDTAGNTATATATAAAFSVTTPALTIIYNTGVDTSTTTRTVSVTTPVTITSTGSDTITLAIAEDAYLGDAQFTVSVDGVQIGGVQTATALHSAGLSQNFTLQGNFGAGPHVVSVDFLNDAFAVYSNNTVAGDRNLYVDAITGDGVTTVENVEQNLAGTGNYTITLPTVTKTTPLAPVVTLATSPSASATSTATLGTAVAGNSGDTLTVKLTSDADFASGSSLALSNGSLVYTPGTISAANAGTDTISYTVTDSTNGLTTTETQKITLVAPVVVKPTIGITSQVLAEDTGASATDDITSDGVVTLTGTVTGATGTVVTIVDGSTVLGTATIASGTWTYSTTLSSGTHTLHAVATDPSGNTATSAAEPSITVDTTAPVVTINTPVQVANTTAVTLSGKVTDATATTVQIKDGGTVLGNATVSNGAWTYTTGNLTAGSNDLSAVATDLAGNTSTASDPFAITTPALTITYTSGVDTSTTTRTVSVTTPVTITSTGSDTITLAIAEDAYLGDAQFTVSVDGVQIGGVQTATALHSAGLSQNFTLQGNFGAGPHVVSVDFLNDAFAVYSNNTVAGDRNLYVDAITGDGVTTVENVEQNLAGTGNYTITLPTVTKTTPLAPVVTLATSPSASATSTATLGTAVAGNSGDALTVKLVSDADFASGSSLALSNGSLVYTPGTISAANAGTDTISYTVTDSSNGLTTTETQKITLVAPVVVKPTIGITSQVLADDTGASATDDITSDGVVTLTGTVTGATGTVVTIVDGSTVLGTATIASGTWTYSTTLSSGTHTLHAVATDPSGNTATSAAEPSITVDTTAPVVTINTPVQVANTTAVTLSGKVTDATATTVQIKDGGTVLGNATVSNGAWTYTTGNLTAGSNDLSAVATDLAGNTSTASDPFAITTPALTIIYNSGVDTSTTTRTVSVTTPVTITSTGSDTITLAIAEDAYLGDAQFTVSVDGVQVGGVQTATALHSAGLSQNFTLQGNFGAGPHVVSVDFLNDAFAIYSNNTVAGDRNLYVDAITGDGVTTVENVEQNLAGTGNYTITLPTVTKTTPLAPVVTLATSPSASATSTATLGTAVAGNSGDTLTVKLTSDADFASGSSLALNNGSLVYTPGTISAANAGTDTISYTVTDSANGLTTTETQKITLVAPQLAPVVTLATSPSASATSTATLGTAVAGNSGDALTVKLVSDADFASGSSLALSNGSLVYTPGTISAANAGTDTISYTVTDSTNGLTTTETQKITLVAPVVVKPTIGITSQVLADDTGASATDDITSDGVVTLTGTVTGATGTVVTIVDGSTMLGTATIASGTWTYSTTLSSGTHTLHAVATDPSGNTATSAAEPSITVDTTAPVVTISTPVQIANTTEVTLSGSVTDATATTVQIKDGSTVLGTATVNNGSWTYTSGNLTAGSNAFSAVATDLAGNTSTAGDNFTITAPATTTTTPDEVLATVSTGTSTAQQEVDLSSTVPITGTYVPVSTSGIGTNPLVLYNWNPSTQLAGFLAAQTAGTASIVGIGDSWTDGFGSAATGWEQLSYLNEMTQALKQDGVAAQSDNFLGSEFYISNGLVDDNRVTPVGYPAGSYYDGGFSIVAGGNAIYLASAGKGLNFQLDTPGNYNEVTVSYIDSGNGSVNLTVDGVAVGSMTFGNTGQTLTQTIKIPAGMHSDLVVESSSANPVYIQGASFSSTTNPAIQVYDGGIGGWDSSSADTSVYQGSALKGSSNGYGQTASAAALKPSLALVDLGINDIAGDEDTTAQSLANIEQIVATLQRAGTDVIIVIPAPFGGTAYATGLPALRAGLEAWATANNVPVIDLSATYDNSYADLSAAGLMSDLDHGDATFYADVGTQLAALLTQTIANAGSNANTTVVTSTDLTTSSTQPAPQNYTLAAGATTITGGAGNNTITATNATLNALDQIDGGSGTNTLVLSGGGTFNLRAPKQLTDIQIVSAAEGQAAVGGTTTGANSGVQVVHLRNGLNVTLNVASGTAAAGNTNPEQIIIYGAADSSTINLGSGKDVVYLGSATETVNAATTGTPLIVGSAAMAGALITGNGQSTTTFKITGSGGSAVLNTADTELTVKLEGSANLTLSEMQFVTADGSVGGSTLTALASGQTLIGGAGDTLIGSTSFGDLFKGTAAQLNQNTIENFGGSDQIDLINILAHKVTGLSWTATSTGGVLSLTDGTRSAALNLTGNYTASSFALKTDGASGTLITAS